MLNVRHVSIHSHITVHVTIVRHVRVILGRVVIQWWRRRRWWHKDWCRGIHGTADNVCGWVSGSLHPVRSRHALLAAPIGHGAVITWELSGLVRGLVKSQRRRWGGVWGWWCRLAGWVRGRWGFSLLRFLLLCLSLTLLSKFSSFVFEPHLGKQNKKFISIRDIVTVKRSDVYITSTFVKGS